MYDIETPGVTLQLGKQGEGLVRTIDFDITGATGTPTLVHKRSDGDEPYFGITEVSGTTLTWTVTKYDTALGGYGVAEIRFDNGDATAKSVLFKTYTIPSVSAADPSGQPEVPDWVQRIIDKVDEIKGMFPEAGTPGYFLRKTVTGMEWADGKGDRGDPGIPGTVISETAPEEEVLWIDPAAAELIQVPEVKDDTINTTDTWSSSKIDDMLTDQSDKITTIDIYTGIRRIYDKRYSNTGTAATIWQNHAFETDKKKLFIMVKSATGIDSSAPRLLTLHAYYTDSTENYVYVVNRKTWYELDVDPTKTVSGFSIVYQRSSAALAQSVESSWDVVVLSDITGIEPELQKLSDELKYANLFGNYEKIYSLNITNTGTAATIWNRFTTDKKRFYIYPLDATGIEPGTDNFARLQVYYSDSTQKAIYMRELHKWYEIALDDSKEVSSLDIVVRRSNNNLSSPIESHWDILVAAGVPVEVITDSCANGLNQYVVNEADRVINLIKDKMILGNTIIFTFNTDQHLNAETWKYTKHSLNAAAYMSKALPMDFICLGGDSASYSSETASDLLSNALSVVQETSGAECRVIPLSGNHDKHHSSADATGEMIFNVDFKKAVQNGFVKMCRNSATNGYWDDEIHGVRFIFLDTNVFNDETYNMTMLQSDLTEMLENAESDKQFVVFSHHPINDELPETWVNPVGLQDILNDYANRIICCICGHVHNDYSATKDGILYISTTTSSQYVDDGKTRTMGTASESAQDVYLIDQNQQKIFAFRYGLIGSNREFTYTLS